MIMMAIGIVQAPGVLTSEIAQEDTRQRPHAGKQRVLTPAASPTQGGEHRGSSTAMLRMR